ncbi:hypothetical protein BpHYR1_016188 [Brachionus plicatilis]|uniref:Uncharacterized protein n=1 Tax=Brachionus plicatilis TaxID=10195 RepID=A0A3M7R3D5_BRAPC|nr:hypothetical protein BpHYR1_016188 [Brachionus plicatilis]
MIQTIFYKYIKQSFQKVRSKLLIIISTFRGRFFKNLKSFLTNEFTLLNLYYFLFIDTEVYKGASFNAKFSNKFYDIVLSRQLIFNSTILKTLFEIFIKYLKFSLKKSRAESKILQTRNALPIN